MRPGGCTSRMIDSAVTDLPLPDSPTRPSVSPARISKLTSSTAGDRSGRRVEDGRQVLDAQERFRVVESARRLSTVYSPKTRAHRVGDFADRRARLDGGDDRRHEIAAVARGLADGGERRAPRGGARGRRGRARTRSICRALDFGIDLQHRDRRVAASSVANRLTPTTTAAPASMASCAR